jgi:hypothetical protein
MTTLIELQARVADLDQQIAEWYERIAKIKPERAATRGVIPTRSKTI